MKTCVPFLVELSCQFWVLVMVAVRAKVWRFLMDPSPPYTSSPIGSDRPSTTPAVGLLPPYLSFTWHGHTGSQPKVVL